MIPYTVNIPAGSDIISISQPTLQTNCNGVNAWTLVDHFEFANAHAGMHKWLQFPTPLATALPTTGNGFFPTVVADKINLFTFLNATTGKNELYIQSSTPTQDPTPITASLKMTTGWSYLPSGMIIQWGTATTNGSVGNTGTGIPFAMIFPHMCFSVQLTPTNNGNNTILMVLKSVITANFTVYSRSGNDSSFTSSNFYYLAIGY